MSAQKIDRNITKLMDQARRADSPAKLRAIAEKLTQYSAYEEADEVERMAAEAERKQGEVMR